LVYIASEWESLSLEELGESITSIVGVVDLTDLDGVVSQVVVDNEWQVLTAAEEAENFAVIVEELLPAWNFTTAGSQGLLHVLLHVVVTWAGNLNKGLVKRVHWDLLALWLRASQVLKELSSVLVSISDTDATAMDANVEADTEVLRHEWAHTVTLEDHLALKEGTLWHTGVLDLWFNDHDGLVLEEIVDEHLVDSVVFKSAFDNAFFEVAVEAENLLVKLDEGGFELLIHVATDVVHVLSLGKGLAHLTFLGAEILSWWLGHCVEWHLHVVPVTVLFELNVAYLLVGDDGWVVSGHVPGQFGEVRRHNVISRC